MNLNLIKSLTVFLLLSSCSAKYYTGEISEDTPIYYQKNKEQKVMTIIPKGEIIIVNKKSKFRKIKFRDTIGWAYEPIVKNEKKIEFIGSFKVLKKKRVSSYTGNGGTIHVKGYYRKDGTYVRPHTRRKSK